MIIDSHAHYNHGSYNAAFRYLTLTPDGYALKEGGRDALLRDLWDGGIRCTVEPGISLQSCEGVLALCQANPGRIFPAIGVHPTRTVAEKWADRKKLAELAQAPGVVAIGETGLDYHFPRKEQHRLTQHRWFLYQLGLARRLKLPVVLHIREAHRDALRVLKRHPARSLGGVVHCYTGDWKTAQEYLKLGYYIGIGGAILQKEERAGALWEAVRNMPPERILLETDAPFILPDCKDVIPGKQLRKARNTSLILPAVIAKIAALKGISPEEAERITAENAARLFRLPVEVR